MKQTLLLAFGLLLIVGCNSAKSEPKAMVEVQAFKGGYDIDFYAQAAEEWAKENPDTTATVDGSPEVWNKLRPRLNSGSPPDLMFPGWGMDHWELADLGQLMALDEALDSPSHDGSGTWRSTFNEQVLKLGQSDGKQYVLPYYVSVMGWWFDPGVFKKHGWDVPKTWDELLELCEKIKAAGIAPITYQGQYPDYMTVGMLMPWSYSIGGKETLEAMQNLEPGAWKSAPVLQAARMIDELNKKGYFEAGALSMKHTDAQAEFLLGKAAMIPCGTWLYAEMEKMIPPGVKMEFMLPPVVAGGKGDPTALAIKIEPWMIPAKAKNPKGAVSLFKYMTSVEKAKQFVEQKGTLMAINGSENAKLPEVLIVPAAKFSGAKAVWANQIAEYYKAFYEEIGNALTEMLNGKTTPEQFCERVEKKAEETRNDSDIKKRKVSM
ncbi:MAG: extracellular solute-binding protein [Fimbriimonadaceae bacterium]|nr:extracellular solute-binding protein [Fimbriimonadaceae bacterium]